MDSKQAYGGTALLAVLAAITLLSARMPLANAADAATASTPDWIQPSGLATGCDGPIAALAVLPDAKLVLGGRFHHCGGIAAANVALWDPQSGQFLPLGTGISGGAFGTEAVVTAIAADADQIVVGGRFTTAGGSVATNVARFRFASQSWEALGASGIEGVNAEVTALARIAGTVFVGGAFDRAGGVVARHLARFDLASAAWTALPAPQPATIVRALAIADGALYVGGDPRRIAEVPTSAVLRFDLGLSTWSTIASLGGRVNSIAITGRTLYAAGDFINIGSTPVGRIAGVDLDTLVTTALGGGIAGGSYFGTAVGAIAATAVDLYVTGDYSNVGGIDSGGGIARHIARYDRSTGRWSSIGIGIANGIDSPGASLIVAGDLGYVAGGFSDAGNLPSKGIAAFSAPEVMFRDGFETNAR